MKKIVLLFCLFISISFNGYAQWVGWEAVPDPPVQLPKDNADEVIDYYLNKYPVPSSPTLISAELIDADCYDFTRQEIVKTKVKVKKYSNGNSKMILVGMKINDTWTSIPEAPEVRLLSIETLLSNAKTEQEKSNLLSLSENFHFIAIDEDENVYGF